MKYSINTQLHTDFNIFEQNKLPARSYFIPFSGTDKISETDYKNERYLSDRVTMLSGEWEFAYFDKLSNIPTDFDTEKQSFDKAEIPCTWQRTGYDQIAYINTRYAFPKKPPYIPADVAVGIYRKKVSLENKSTHRILTFLGVAGALAVYMNGKYVGYSEGSHNTAEFDITPFAVEGENELIAVVYKWSNGSYLECQDMFRENGIFRDVYIISHGDSYVTDFLFRPLKNADGSYNLRISIIGEFADNTAISVRAEDKDGKALFETDSADITLKNLTVREWTAETPNLYTVTVRLLKNGEEIEAIRTYIGFKDIKINKTVFLFNGKPVKMKGVNHHDTHMTKGYAMSIEDLEKDAVLMKEYNCNAVRMAHYPPDPVFLTMCDFYGLYAVDEADIETHAFYSNPMSYHPGKLSNDPKWAPHYLDRVVRMYERDKNHPSVTMWSLGNESGGYKCQDVCYDFLKKHNPEIPVHYEGVNRSKRWAYDVVSHMYAYPELMRKVRDGKGGKKYDNKPFFQCEYAHAMGNGPGGLEEYMQLFYSSEQFMGGCIWEWADHSVYDENAKYKWTYGGDHNEPIHDGNFCVDGLFYPDRRPSSGALEMKAVYRPVRAKYLNDYKIELWNTRGFADTSDILINWEISVDGEITEKGSIEPVIAAGENKTVSLSDKIPKYSQKDVFINLIYTDKSTGYEIAREQLTVELKKLSEFTAGNNAKYRDSGASIDVSFKNGSARFDKKKGFVGYTMNGREFISHDPIDGQHGFIPHIYRGRLDNDRFMKIFWDVIGLEQAKACLKECKLKEDGNGRFVRTVYNFVTRGIIVLARASVDYRFSENGKLTVSVCLTKVFPLTSQLPRFGVHIELPSELCNVSYYGRGPEESYSDFKEHAPVGLYNTTVDKMAHKYIMPQDSGNREEVRHGSITDGQGEGIAFAALGDYIRFNANPYTLSQLIAANHIEDLPDCDVTFVSFDGFQRGTGSGSCGPNPSKEHLIDFGYTKPLKFSFELNIVNSKK